MKCDRIKSNFALTIWEGIVEEKGFELGCER